MNTNKFLRNTILTGIFIIPFIPLVVTPSALFPFINLFFPFITGKNFFFRIIVGIVFALWLILSLRDKSYWPKKSLILYSVLVLTGVLGLATIFGVNPYSSFWSSYERMGGYVGFLHLSAYFVVLISILRTKMEWLKFWRYALFANTLVVLYGLLQVVGLATIHQGGVRLDATLGNAAYLASYSLFFIFISAYLYFSERKGSGWRWFYATMTFLNTFILIFTETRGAILGLLVGTGLAGLILAIFSKGKIKKYSLGIIIALIALLGTFFIAKDTALVKNISVLNRFATISLTEATTQSRFLIWQMSWQGFKERPILGWGPENYDQVFSKYYDPLLWRQEPWFDRSHNVFFDWLIDAGILGLLAYLSIFVSAFYYLFKYRMADQEKIKKDKVQQDNQTDIVIKSVLVGLLAGYLFQNIFVFDNLISYIFFFSVLAFIHFNYIQNKDGLDKVPTKIQSSAFSQSAIIGLSGLILVSLVGVLYLVDYKPLMASKILIQALTPQASTPQTKDGPAKNLEYFKKVFELNTFGSLEAREHLLSATPPILQTEGLSDDIKKAFVDLSIEKIKEQIEIFPNKARVFYSSGIFFINLNRFEEGVELLERARELSPQKQPILFALIFSYLNLGEEEKALALAKQAYEAEPNYPQARNLYILTAFQSGKSSSVDSLKEEIKDDPSYFNDDAVLRYFLGVGNSAEALSVLNNRVAWYKDKIKEEPANLENYSVLFDTYVTLGQNENAKNLINEAIEAIPSFTDQGIELLKQLGN